MNIGPLELVLILTTALIFIVPVVTIVALVDVLRVPSDSQFRTGSRIVWVLVTLLVPIIGPFVYFAAGKPQAQR